MKLFRELYYSSHNYVKGYFSIMRYLNELILKGRVKRVSLLLAISIDSDHKVFFFIIIIFNACRCISRVGLEKSRGYN